MTLKLKLPLGRKRIQRKEGKETMNYGGVHELW